MVITVYKLVTWTKNGALKSQSLWVPKIVVATCGIRYAEYTYTAATLWLFILEHIKILTTFSVTIFVFKL